MSTNETVLVHGAYNGDSYTWHHVDRNTRAIGGVFLTITPGAIVKFANWKGGFYARRVDGGRLSLIWISDTELNYPSKLPTLVRSRRGLILFEGVGLVEIKERQAKNKGVFHRLPASARR